MQKIIPFILTGSLIYFYNVFVSFFPALPDLSPILNFSFGLISLIVAFMMANQCMEKLNHPFYITNAGITSVCVLLMAVIPQEKIQIVCLPFWETWDHLELLLGWLSVFLYRSCSIYGLRFVSWKGAVYPTL